MLTRPLPFAIVPRMNGMDLKVARIRAGLSQAEVAKRIGVTRRTLNYWEKPTAEVPEYKADAYLRALLRDVA